MRLAEEITVLIAGEAVELRPSLRLALQLERREGGFAKVLREIDDLSLGTMAELIEPHHGGGTVFINQVFDAGLGNLRPALIAYVLALAGVDPEQAEKAAAGPKGKTVPLGAHLLDLYRIGTGWIGWTPEATLDATPAEITEAFKGRQDLLRAVFGGKDDKPKDIRPIGEKFRSIFSGLGTVKEPAA